MGFTCGNKRNQLYDNGYGYVKEEFDMSRGAGWVKRLDLNIEPIEIILPVDAIGEWVRYYSWTEDTKFLIKSIDKMNKKIIGTYIMKNGYEQRGTTFNLCKGISTKSMRDYWHIIKDKRVDFSLDDKLFEI
jgi:hypothetical protein